ncbi:MAG: LysM peptidoglycan-binding domain-containing protein [Halanaerobiaceae bacterium]|jgi:LysM repeat protein|nr:LysM peptidoglycan-binding domain-containing protein [Halanaerobiaceae bacterium]
MPGNCPQDTIPYTIKPGDTLYRIAREYNTTVDAILNINPGINPQNLIIGSMICVPTLRH